ncbi:uncharacterized protein LOC106050877 [Biomphalaria glabrata]|uniref:Uncharacterized protein LOC106050877 n=1 Tax=Biomphalaria glabrata TaxID=6526 RepID=A0A9W2ZMZ3_BIOGL|nr:uncharacterized protein LOC106050877 [Biomphalaria glabrata]
MADTSKFLWIILILFSSTREILAKSLLNEKQLDRTSEEESAAILDRFTKLNEIISRVKLLGKNNQQKQGRERGYELADDNRGSTADDFERASGHLDTKISDLVDSLQDVIGMLRNEKSSENSEGLKQQEKNEASPSQMFLDYSNKLDQCISDLQTISSRGEDGQRLKRGPARLCESSGGGNSRRC